QQPPAAAPPRRARPARRREWRGDGEEVRHLQGVGGRLRSTQGAEQVPGELRQGKQDAAVRREGADGDEEAEGGGVRAERHHQGCLSGRPDRRAGGEGRRQDRRQKRRREEGREERQGREEGEEGRQEGKGLISSRE